MSIPAMEGSSGSALATLTLGNLNLANQNQDLAALNTDLSKANTQVEIFDIERLKARQESAAALSELLNGLTGDISAKLGFAEGSAEKTALHAAVGAIVAKMAGGDATGALAGAVSEIANGIVQDLLKANPDLNDAQKASLTQWAAVAVGAAVGGQLGAATALDNVNYNYLNHQDAAALAVAKLDCASGDQAACQTASALEAKDIKQQEDYLACRSTNYGAAGCGAVFADVTAALASYSGIAPFTLSDSERLAILDSNGNLNQIIKILAPYGAASLSDERQRELATLVHLLTGDITGITASPAALQEIASGDVTSFAQVWSPHPQYGSQGLEQSEGGCWEFCSERAHLP